jgi:hypothetical protein
METEIRNLHLKLLNEKDPIRRTLLRNELNMFIEKIRVQRCLNSY